MHTYTYTHTQTLSLSLGPWPTGVASGPGLRIDTRKGLLPQTRIDSIKEPKPEASSVRLCGSSLEPRIQKGRHGTSMCTLHTSYENLKTNTLGKHSMSVCSRTREDTSAKQDACTETTPQPDLAWNLLGKNVTKACRQQTQSGARCIDLNRGLRSCDGCTHPELGR